MNSTPTHTQHVLRITLQFSDGSTATVQADDGHRSALGETEMSSAEVWLRALNCNAAETVSGARSLLADNARLREACQHALDTFGGMRPEDWMTASRLEFDILTAALSPEGASH